MAIPRTAIRQKFADGETTTLLANPFAHTGRDQEVIVLQHVQRRHRAGIWRQRADQPSRVHVEYERTRIFASDDCPLTVFGYRQRPDLDEWEDEWGGWLVGCERWMARMDGWMADRWE